MVCISGEDDLFSVKTLLLALSHQHRDCIANVGKQFAEMSAICVGVDMYRESKSADQSRVKSKGNFSVLWIQQFSCS